MATCSASSAPWISRPAASPSPSTSLRPDPSRSPWRSRCSAQPHLVAVLDTAQQPHSTRAPTRPVNVPMEILGDVLDWGAGSWRSCRPRSTVGGVLPEAEACAALVEGALWPAERRARHLFSVLFPAVDPDGVGPVDFISEGAQLYAVIDQPHPPRPDALYIAWLDRQHGWAPCGTFHGRYVDPTLREQLGRAIGADARRSTSCWSA